MFKEIKNNVYNALFVVADEDGRRYAAFENDWNDEYWEATACTESGELVTGESVKLYPIMVYHAESDQYETIGYSDGTAGILIPGWRDYQVCGYFAHYSISPAPYDEASDRVYFVLPEGSEVYSNSLDLPIINWEGFAQDAILNQYDARGCRPYIIGHNTRRAYLKVIEL